MEVILLDNIGKLGGLGDKVTVKPGYGRNYLVPYGLAVPATKENVEALPEVEGGRGDGGRWSGGCGGRPPPRPPRAALESRAARHSE